PGRRLRPGGGPVPGHARAGPRARQEVRPAERRAAREDGGTSPVTIQKIGVIGAGQMGNGIAHVAALAGYDVKLSDISEEQLRKAIERISENMERQVRRQLITE